jgi:hypothetical protein
MAMARSDIGPLGCSILFRLDLEGLPLAHQKEALALGV